MDCGVCMCVCEIFACGTEYKLNCLASYRFTDISYVI